MSVIYIGILIKEYFLYSIGSAESTSIIQIRKINKIVRKQENNNGLCK